MIVLKNMARVELADEHKAQVLKLYTHYGRGEEFIRNYKYSKGVAYLPLNMNKLRMVSEIVGQEISDQRSRGSALSEPFVLKDSFELRAHQVEPAPRLLKDIQINQYGVLQAGCGLGKTSVMTWCSGQLGVKTLIIVDMGSLVSQWQDAFKMVWGRSVQVIDRDTKSFSDVCISTFQLLNFNDELVSTMREEFGCLLLDEFHTAGADTRKEVLFKLSNYYRIGCTATPYKKNFSDDVLSDLVADVSVVMHDDHALKPDIYFVKTGSRLYSQNPDDWGKIQSHLSKDKVRNSSIAELTLEQCRLGRKILVIGITIEMLKEVEQIINKCPECKPRVYTGSTTLVQDRALRDDMASGKINVVLTVRKADKGLDINSLDCLILAKPANNQAFVTQISGRIVRSLPGKPTPVIYDLVDSGSLAEGFARNRKKWYRRLDYNISVDTQ